MITVRQIAHVYTICNPVHSNMVVLHVSMETQKHCCYVLFCVKGWHLEDISQKLECIWSIKWWESCESERINTLLHGDNFTNSYIFTVTLQHCHHTPRVRSDFRADDPTGTPLLHYSYRIDLWPLKKYRGTKSCQPARSIQTPANINAHWTDCHMTPRVYHKRHNPHLEEKKKKHHLTWNVSGFLTCRKTFKTCHVVRRPRSHRRCLVRGAVKIKTWLEMWIPKTPAKPGSNYLCSGSQGELFD